MKRFLQIIIVLLLSGHVQAQQLISSEFKGTISQPQLALQFGPLIQNGVNMYKITYATPDPFGQPDTASGLLVVPIRPGFTLPMLICHRGTVSGPADVPSNLAGGFQLGLAFGGMGYVTSMPDLLGMGTSRGFHPYVHAATAASASVDMLRAVRQYAAQHQLSINQQLFITGYSQGGYSAMATYKDIQENHSPEFTVTAAAPLSGPYSMSGVMREAILSDAVYMTPSYVPNTLLSYDYIYDIYGSPQHYLKEPYATMSQRYFNREINLTTLNAMLIQQLTQDFGASIPRHMLQDSVVAAVMNQPDHPVNQALADNDVYDWTPMSPTRLFYCRADDQVSYRNSVVADSVMNLNGAPNVQAVDVNTSANHTGCVQPALFNTAFFFGQYQSITLTSSTREERLLSDVRVWPNPAQSFFYLESVPAAARIEVFDGSGIRHYVAVSEGQLHAVPVDRLARGVHYVRITAREGNWYGKVMIP